MPTSGSARKGLAKSRMDIFLHKHAADLKPGEIFILPGLDICPEDKPYVEVVSIGEPTGWNINMRIKVAAILPKKTAAGNETLLKTRETLKVQGETYTLGETKELQTPKDTPVTYLTQDYRNAIQQLSTQTLYEAYCVNGEIELRYTLPQTDEFWKTQIISVIKEQLSRKSLHLVGIKLEGFTLKGKLHCVSGNKMFQPENNEKHHAVPAFQIQDNIQPSEIEDIKNTFEILTKDGGNFNLELIDGQIRFVSEHPGTSRQNAITALTEHFKENNLLLEADEEGEMPNEKTLSGFITRDHDCLLRYKEQYEGQKISFRL
jgi:hypothetical protein